MIIWILNKLLQKVAVTLCHHLCLEPHSQGFKWYMYIRTQPILHFTSNLTFQALTLNFSLTMYSTSINCHKFLLQNGIKTQGYDTKSAKIAKLTLTWGNWRMGHCWSCPFSECLDDFCMGVGNDGYRNDVLDQHQCGWIGHPQPGIIYWPSLPKKISFLTI